MSAEKATALLALDWGTTSLRAFLVAADGTVLEHRSTQHGILQVRDGDFAAAQVLGDLLHCSFPSAAGTLGGPRGVNTKSTSARPACRA